MVTRRPLSAQEYKVPAANMAARNSPEPVFAIADNRDQVDIKLTVEAAPMHRGHWLAGRLATGRAAGADGRRTGWRPARTRALVTTERRRGASSQSAHQYHQMVAGDSGHRSLPVAPARPAGPDGTVSSLLGVVTEAQADRIATQAAPHCMITGSCASQPGRPSCPRRFVVIYRRRQREGHGRHGHILVDVMIFSVSQTLRQSHRAAAWR